MAKILKDNNDVRLRQDQIREAASQVCQGWNPVVSQPNTLMDSMPLFMEKLHHSFNV